MSRGLSLLPLALLAACHNQYDPCFAPSSLVSDLRILALRADPPEVMYDPGQQPPVVSVQTLLAAPEETQLNEVRLSVRLCLPPQPEGPCPDGTPVLGTAQNKASFTPAFPVQVTEAMLEASRATDPLHGFGGVRVQVQVDALAASGATASATKLLLFSPNAPGSVPNHALEVSGLTLLVPHEAERTLAPREVTGLDVGTQIGLLPLLAPGDGASEAAEQYFTTDLSGQRVQLREHITYSFFTTPHLQYGTAGQPVAGADQGVEPDPGVAPPPSGVTQMVALSTSIGHIYVVARDGRGGVAWSAFGFVSTDQRQCVNPVVVDGPTNHCASLENTCG